MLCCAHTTACERTCSASSFQPPRALSSDGPKGRPGPHCRIPTPHNQKRYQVGGLHVALSGELNFIDFKAETLSTHHPNCSAKCIETPHLQRCHERGHGHLLWRKHTYWHLRYQIGTRCNGLLCCAAHTRPHASAPAVPVAFSPPSPCHQTARRAVPVPIAGIPLPTTRSDIRWVDFM